MDWFCQCFDGGVVRDLTVITLWLLQKSRFSGLQHTRSSKLHGWSGEVTGMFRIEDILSSSKHVLVPKPAKGADKKLHKTNLLSCLAPKQAQWQVQINCLVGDSLPLCRFWGQVQVSCLTSVPNLISVPFVLNCVSYKQTDAKSKLVQVIAVCGIGTSPLPETMMTQYKCHGYPSSVYKWGHHDMKTLSTIFALCEGNPLVIVRFLTQSPSNEEFWWFGC